MFQRFPVVKVGHKSEKLLNEIRQIMYSLYRAKQVIKKVYKNIMDSNKVIKENVYYIYEFWK